MINKSLYGQYLKERENFEIIESDEGFASYIIMGEECYIRDVYVLPELRKLNVATHLCDQIAEIAKTKGCKFLTGTVVPSLNGSTQSLNAVLKYGFKLHSSTHEKIVLMKELK